MGNRIYIEPVKPVMKKLDKLKEQDILLMGGEGTGKSVVLNEYVKQSNWDHVIVDGTVRPEEMILVADPEVSNLYRICLLVSKMISKINSDYKELADFFFSLDTRINGVLRNIYNMHMFGNYTSKYNNIGVNLCAEPEILLEEFLDLATKHIGMQSTTVILDNFDVVGYGNFPSSSYQRYMYNLLKDYVRLLATVSDNKVLNNEEEKNRLMQDNALIEIGYIKNVNVVKEIIDSNVSVGRFKNERIGLLLSNETIMLMIEKTNGNLFDILRTIREFYRNLSTLNKVEYDAFVLNYIDNVINKNPIFTGHIKKERRLYI